MKILLINPCLRRSSPRKWFPIGLAYIATAADRAGYPVTIYDIDAHRHSDQEFEAFLKKNKFDVVGFGCLVTHYAWTQWATGVIRETQPHAKIILGNTVSTSIPDRILSRTDADIAVIGEGDVTFVEILKAMEHDEPFESVDGIHFKKGDKIISNPLRTPIADLDSMPYPNRDLFDIEVYLEATPTTVGEPYPIPLEQIQALNINTSRGCVFSCTFCYHGFQGTGYRYRSAESVVGEILELKSKYGVNFLHLFDDLTFSARGMVEKFCDKLISEGLHVFWTGSILATLFGKPSDRDADIVRKMKQTGCVSVGYSIESANLDILNAMNKHISLEGFANTRKTLLAGGVASLSSVVFGYPQETRETIKNTVDFCIDLGITPSAGFLLPLPGTPMYDLALQRGVIEDEEEYLTTFADRQDLTVNLTTMSDEDLVQTVTDEITRCQKAVLGDDISFDNPLKTGKYTSRDDITSDIEDLDAFDSESGVNPTRLDSGSAYTVFDYYKVDGMVPSVESNQSAEQD